MRYVLVPVLATALFCRGAEPQPGHSAHGEAFNEGPRQAATLLPGCGSAVRFSISSQNEMAQRFFTQGVGQVHGFWYYEAERSFRQVAALDAECAMAYWGMAMANVNNEKRAKAFVAKATALKGKASAREKQWIGMLENLYRDDKRDKKQRSLDCIRDLEALVQDDPQDIEAKAFLVWRIWFSREEAPLSSRQAVDALLDQIFAAAPDHPAHHYRIHLWDDTKPIRAVGSAAQCGQAAPGIAHMWHMPGHTFSKLKRYDDAAWQQEASTRVDHAYMMRSFVLPDQIHNYAHNEEWLVRTFNELGRAKDAEGLARSLIGNPRHPEFNTLEKQNTSASYGRTRLIETLAKWELWPSLQAFTQAPAGQLAHEVTRLRAAGVAAYHLQDRRALAAALQELEKLKVDEPATKKPAAKAKGAKPAPEKPEAKARKAAVGELRALVALAAPKLDKAEVSRKLEALKETDTPKERLARYWLKAGHPIKAAEVASSLAQDLAGLAAKTEVLQAAGQAAEAKKAFEETRKLAFAMDRDLPVAKRLDALAKDAFGLSGDWPAAPPKRGDSGQRPELATLGPRHWQAPEAPVFEALNLENERVKSTDLIRQKPTLFLFYLGADCGHCVEQVQAFAKVVGEFEKLGVQIVAVSSEPTQVAGKLREKLGLAKEAALPFTLLCDSSGAAFKAVRAYDDFEKELLHATVLVDSQGRQRWQDVSWQPFTNTRFLLEETKRLLGL